MSRASRHRSVPDRRTPPSRHRATRVRPRYGRLTAAGTALTVTAIALLGGTGVLPGVGDRSDATAARARDSSPSQLTPAGFVAPNTTPSTATGLAPTTTPTVTPTDAPTVTPTVASTPVPADSGQGRRVVFSQAQQRVWLIGVDGNVQRTYLVSGSRLDNLDPGSYQVYSRSRWAVGVDDSGVMQYFVRFTQGPTGAAIGFHSIPTSHGTPLQTKAQLGTPESHGCIRQAKTDALVMWGFAPVGTHVTVVA